MGNWNETCQISSLPIYAEEQCYVFLVENVNPTQKVPISSGMNSKYSVVCSPILGEYDELGGLNNINDIYNVLPIFKEKAGCDTEDFSVISAKLFDNEKYHLVWVKKELFDIVKERDYVKEYVKCNLLSLEWKTLKSLKKDEDQEFAKWKCNRNFDYMNVNNDFLWGLLDKEDNEEILLIFSLLEILRQLRKTLCPSLGSNQGEISELFRDISKFIMINF